MIRFNGRLQYDEFRRAQWLSSPWWARWFGWGLLALFAVVFITSGGWSPGDGLVDLIRPVAILAFALIMIVMPRRAIRRVWEQTPLLHEEVSGTLGDDGVTWETGSTRTTLTWDKIVRRQTAPDTILLYTSERQALILPRRYFATEDDWRSATAIATP